MVIEDSEIGCKAGKVAGMKVVVTKSIYTENENFDGAEAVIKDLDNGLMDPLLPITSTINPLTVLTRLKKLPKMLIYLERPRYEQHGEKNVIW